MKIIEPKVELWRQEDAKAHVARCARVCYGKETGNDEASYKYRTNTDKMTASDYTHLFGYLNPYYRTAYSIPKRKR